MPKRNDIQGIRGLAIAGVLAFHLNEGLFPAGFVGVDIFFVLSGYLMAVILSKETYLSLKIFGDFYIRRFKRIVPLYAILIGALAILVPCFLLRREVAKFCTDVVWAAAFATNIHTVLEEQDYFAELSSLNVLTHTWSLGVEIQYYLIVPFIILTQRALSQKYHKFPFIIILLKVSLIFQHFSSPQTAFNMLPSRVWQFLAGGLSHDYSLTFASGSTIKYEKLPTVEQVKQETGRKRISANLITVILLAFVFAPWMILPATLLRPLAVLLTSVLLVLGCDESRQGILLTNRPLVYLGDISYVVYLAHWPIVIIWKSISDSLSLSFFGIYCCLALTFAISICAHHTIEQFFIRAKTNTATVVVALIYAFLAIALVFNAPMTLNASLENQAPSADVAAAIEWNEEISHNEYRQHKPFQECVSDPEGVAMRGGYSGKDRFECLWKPENSTGPITILVLGNSISHLAVSILKPVIEQNFPQVKLMRLFAMPACHPMEVIQYVCPPYFKALPKQVQAMKPDITFVMFDDSKKLPAPLINAEKDKTIKEFKTFLQPIVNSSRMVILDEFYPRPTATEGGDFGAASLNKRLIRNQPADDLKATYRSFQEKYVHYFARLDRINFPNMIRHNTSAALCAEEKGWCWWYNRRNNHAYFTDHTHLTPDGLELLRESYTMILRSAIDRLETRDVE